MRWCLLVACVLVSVTGCGGPKFAPVSGRITLDGKPLPHASVNFQPDSEERNPGPGSKGKTDSNGQYSLQVMNGDTRGAVVGKHKVSITAYEGDDTIPSSGSDMVFRKRLVPSEYNAATKLTYDVPPEGTTTADFMLKSSNPP